MNASMGMSHNETEVSYAVDFGRDREPMQKRSRHPQYRRQGAAPARVGGMHCRRNKRWTWGSGRGARMANVRAFAGSLAFALATVAASAFGVTINYSTVGNPGNTGNPSSNPAGTGAVTDIFRLATTETTNAQYVAFLNSVDPSGTNPNSIYNSSMGSAANGGITFTAGASAGAKYTVKSGTGPVGSAYGSMPVNFVSWFSAARFANWLNNGATSSSSTETGAYTLSGTTSGAVIARNPGAQVFLPSVNEWYKAAFFTGTGSTYWTYQTQANSTPTATVSNFTLANAGNFAAVTTGPIAVGSYTNATSNYGLFDMLGNVTEFVDTPASGSNAYIMGGNFANPNIANWNALAALRSASAAGLSDATGFRVAAVPEPGTIALAGMGVAGLAGLDWMKRRKKRMAARHEG
jgi:formylglycine-generating enzyme required for sulfatase activity